MKFFIPGTENLEQAEIVWTTTTKIALKNMGWNVSNRRIYRIDYIHDEKDGSYEVGKIAPDNGESVIVILESNAYLVCTKTRGVARGLPILMGRDEVWHVKDFEDSPNKK